MLAPTADARPFSCVLSVYPLGFFLNPITVLHRAHMNVPQILVFKQPEPTHFQKITIQHSSMTSQGVAACQGI